MLLSRFPQTVPAAAKINGLNVLLNLEIVVRNLGFVEMGQHSAALDARVVLVRIRPPPLQARVPYLRKHQALSPKMGHVVLVAV